MTKYKIILVSSCICVRALPLLNQVHLSLSLRMRLCKPCIISPMSPLLQVLSYKCIMRMQPCNLIHCVHLQAHLLMTDQIAASRLLANEEMLQFIGLPS